MMYQNRLFAKKDRFKGNARFMKRNMEDKTCRT